MRIVPLSKGLVLVAGAGGRLGREVALALRHAGYRVRAFAGDLRHLGGALPHVDDVAIGSLEDGASLQAACAGADIVFSCAGASARFGAPGDRAGFDRVTARGNLALLARARAAGASKFVYVSLYGGRALAARSAYAAAHERVVEAVYGSGMAHAIVRPTDLFAFHDATLRLAARGLGLVAGDGQARTNPIAERDLAAVCAAAVEHGGGEIPAGGPEVYTRRELVELAFEAVHRVPRIATAHPAALRAAAAVARRLNPRLAALAEFAAEMGTLDAVAPPHGSLTLPDYFARRASQLRGGARAGRVSTEMLKLA